MEPMIRTAVVIVLFVALAACVPQKKNYVMAQNLLDQQGIFRTSQEPAFTMALPEGVEFVEQTGSDYVDTAGHWDNRRYRFVKQGDKYIIDIAMTTVHLAEWGADQPWTESLDKKVYGKRVFRSGMGIFPEKCEDKGDIEATYKAWMYLPGGNGFPGSTRVVVYYIELGDQTTEQESFLKRADNRINFEMI